jgi:hypothetical protein
VVLNIMGECKLWLMVHVKLDWNCKVETWHITKSKAARARLMAYKRN